MPPLSSFWNGRAMKWDGDLHRFLIVHVCDLIRVHGVHCLSTAHILMVDGLKDRGLYDQIDLQSFDERQYLHTDLPY